MARLTHRTGPGWTYLVTTKAWQNVAVFQVTEIAEVVVAKLLEYRRKEYYLLHEFVLMPNHLHLLLTPSNRSSLERAMGLIKGGSSHETHCVRKNKIQIWQSGFHESRVTDPVHYKNKANYIHLNPVTARQARHPQDWPYSSAASKYHLDPIPPGLKPSVVTSVSVGPEGPTPNTLSIPTTP